MKPALPRQVPETNAAVDVEYCCRVGSWVGAMILGVGTDMIDIRRIEEAIARYGDRFLSRIFTQTERERSDGRTRLRAASYAKRFAAKEACAKALGTGLRRGVYWRDMGVINLPSGRPTLQLGGGAAEQLSRMTPEGCQARIDLTLTDDFPMAHAIVIISAIPTKEDRR
jgi:holo-[acyl-carrier protein] synthase